MKCQLVWTLNLQDVSWLIFDTNLAAHIENDCLKV